MGEEEPAVPVKSMNRPVFVLAGSFLKVKGFDRFVRVAARLRDDGFGFSAIIMGMGYERDELEKLIAEKKLENCISLYEYQSNPYAIIKNADAFVCSSYSEGYSTVITEAVILGKPVITTRCSGMEEIFGGRECGIICENDEDSMYAALRSVLEDPQLLKKFAAESEIRSGDFKKEIRAAAINDFYKNLEKK